MDLKVNRPHMLFLSILSSASQTDVFLVEKTALTRDSHFKASGGLAKRREKGLPTIISYPALIFRQA